MRKISIEINVPDLFDPREDLWLLERLIAEYFAENWDDGQEDPQDDEVDEPSIEDGESAVPQYVVRVSHPGGVISGRVFSSFDEVMDHLDQVVTVENQWQCSLTLSSGPKMMGPGLRAAVQWWKFNKTLEAFVAGQPKVESLED